MQGGRPHRHRRQRLGVRGPRRGDRRPGADFYFATPCHSRERGLIEHANDRIRRFFGKGEELREVDPAKSEYVEVRLNHCPRRVPGFRTPAQTLAEARGLSPPVDPFPLGCG